MARLDGFIQDSKKESNDHLLEMQRFEREHKILERAFKLTIAPHIKPASASHYKQWLTGYLDNGGKPSHFYDYDLPKSFYIATSNFISLNLCGSTAIHVIVPKGIDIDTSEGIGHCSFYLMSDFSIIGHWVPVYRNTVI